MSKFIEITEGGRSLFINVSHIISLEPTGEKQCFITVLPSDRKSYTADQSYEEVKRLINE